MEKIKQILRSATGAGNHKPDTTIHHPSFQPGTFVNLPPPKPPRSKNPPRLLIVGAGSRGYALARAIVHGSNGFVAAVADPVATKRQRLGRNHIWGIDEPKEGQEFNGWKEFLEWEQQRRIRVENGEEGDEVPAAIDGVVICTLDQTHAEIVKGLAPLNLHILCEKPLATTLDDCLQIYRTIQGMDEPKLFGVGHIVRYAPRSTLLKKLLLEDEVVGDIVSVVHTENIGWWHFAHSYVRGNWRRSSVSGPTLLTKSCHDIDFLLWLLCSPGPRPNGEQRKPHIPSSLTATGSLVHFKKSRKPTKANDATNCLSCPAEPECQFSSRNIYWDKGIRSGLPGWPVNVVLPDVEDYLNDGGRGHAGDKLMEALSEDYGASTPAEEIKDRSWYGRCVYESDNDVCDEYVVTISWDDDPITCVSASENQPHQQQQQQQPQRGSKTATFHMTAFSEDLGTRKTVVHGTKGELEADNTQISVRKFGSIKPEIHRPSLAIGGHGGGDHGLAEHFVLAIDAVKNHGATVEEAQERYLGTTPEDALRSHALIFAAEEARKGKFVVDWKTWWEEHVEKSESRTPPSAD